MFVNDYNLAFAPKLSAGFSEQESTLKPEDALDSRILFHQLIHLNENYAVLPKAYQYLQIQLHKLNQGGAGKFIQEINPDKLLVKENITDFPGSSIPASAKVDALVHFAPVFLTEPAWLAGVTQTATSQAPLAVDLTRSYLKLIKGEQSLAHCRLVFSAYLLTLGRQIPDVSVSGFIQQTPVCAEAFEMGVLQLALGQFPRTFFAEILGFTLAYCAAPSLANPWLDAGTHSDFGHFLAVRTAIKAEEREAIAALIRNYLTVFQQDRESLWWRVQSGFLLYRQLSANLIHAINALLNQQKTPKQSAESLILSLLPHAIGHHARIELAGKSLDHWFAEQPFKTAEFCQALLNSPYVDSNQPGNSKLLKLFAFEGPMFGVLDSGGIKVLRNWLESEFNSLKQNNNPALTPESYNRFANPVFVQEDKVLAARPAKSLQENDNPADFSKLTNRQLFYYLVNWELFPDIFTVARTKARLVMNFAKWLNPLPFKPYTHQAFEAYINGIYQKEANQYKPLADAPKLSKAAYVWGIEQFAPAILTDGSWLQGAHQLAFYSNHVIGTYLDKIYHDECGQGLLEQNHPFIYQTLLESLGIKLPPIFTPEFSKHPGFIDSAFDIPVFLMAIAKFPSAFLPEILGLNMAIELSGLGKVYLRLSQELRYWGINPAIVDIHISIDNLATGHSALAIRAIQTYLDEISATCGNDIMQAHWRRIHTGYCALQTAGNRFKFSLIGRYFFKRPQATKND
jgi:hypothetical protein